MSNTAARASRAYIITGPTSGIGLATAYELAKHGTIILVGRDLQRLAEVRKIIKNRGGRAVSVVCDLSEIDSVKRAAAEIIALNLPIVGLLNNAGIMQPQATKNSIGWDMSYATNHIGPFVLTELVAPHLTDGANVIFVASAVEDPERKPAAAVGFRGARYISAQASARGEWKADGSKLPGADAYATSKQCTLVTALEFAREIPRLRFSAIEPGVTPATSLGRNANASVKLLTKFLVPIVVPLLMPFMKYLSTPKRAAQVITNIMLKESGPSGIYYDESGEPKNASELARDPKFTARVVAETRELLTAL